MKIGRHLSDQAYVEEIRKRDYTFRRIRWIWAVLLVLSLVAMFIFNDFIQGINDSFPESEAGLDRGLILGAIFGFMFAMLASQAGHCFNEWLDARNGYRTERLLLKYYDELKGKEQ